jgi:hypothetical protein
MRLVPYWITLTFSVVTSALPIIPSMASTNLLIASSLSTISMTHHRSSLTKKGELGPLAPLPRFPRFSLFLRDSLASRIGKRGEYRAIPDVARTRSSTTLCPVKIGVPKPPLRRCPGQPLTQSCGWATQHQLEPSYIGVVGELPIGLIDVRCGSLADIRACISRCPLYRQKQTCSSPASISALCHKRTCPTETDAQSAPTIGQPILSRL